MESKDIDTVFVCISAISPVSDYTIWFKEDSLFIDYKIENSKAEYGCTINLFNEIDIEKSQYELTEMGYTFILKKKTNIHWPDLSRDDGPRCLRIKNVPELTGTSQHDQTNQTCSSSEDENVSKPDNSLLKKCSSPVENFEKNNNLQFDVKIKGRCINKRYNTVENQEIRHVQVNKPFVHKIIFKHLLVTISNIKVTVHTPTEMIDSAEIFYRNKPGSYGIKYDPREIGTHLQHVFVKGKLHVILLTEVFDLKMVEYDVIETGGINEPVNIKVNYSKAGEGLLEVTVQHQESQQFVPCYLEKMDTVNWKAFFTPRTYGSYCVFIKFNGKIIKSGSDKYTFIWNIPIKYDVIVKFPKVEIFTVEECYNIMIENRSCAWVGKNYSIVVDIIGPSGNKINSTLVLVSSTVYHAAFVPKETRNYTINVTVNCYPSINNTPFHFKAYNFFGFKFEDTVIYIPMYKDYSNKLSHLQKIPVNQFAIFFITFAGSKDRNCVELDVLITGPNEEKVPPLLVTAKGSFFEVEFKPTVIGDHVISVKYNGNPVKGTPFISEVISDNYN